MTHGRPLDECDSLYVAPHADDVPLSCASRLLSEVEDGLSVTVVSVFGDPQAPAHQGLARRRVREISLGLPPAAARHASYARFESLSGAPLPEDEAWVNEAAAALADARHRMRARHVYVPLGVGGHIDHRLAHDAALRAFESGEGRNVFLYEERPEAFVRGAVRMRLGQIGARLPAGAAEAADDTSLAAFLFAYHVPGSLRGDLKGWGERARGIRGAARHWRGARSWNPGKGLGPRLHPLLHETPDAALPAVQELIGEAAASARAADRMAALASRYARRLGAHGHAERLWLLLPAAAHGRLTPMRPPEIDAAAS
jgi:LmbE family N-acetylglucosaminyl deacetylase